ncbi:hypothetical protein FRC07_001581 [Ceratobasidium sp. 392]|nr:hypothetical protein FRC07_001581 [Ceratobasidium sp. 392]
MNYNESNILILVEPEPTTRKERAWERAEPELANSGPEDLPAEWPEFDLSLVLVTGLDNLQGLSEAEKGCIVGVVPYGYESIIQAHIYPVTQAVQAKVMEAHPEGGFFISNWHTDLVKGLGVTKQGEEMDSECDGTKNISLGLKQPKKDSWTKANISASDNILQKPAAAKSIISTASATSFVAQSKVAASVALSEASGDHSMLMVDKDEMAGTPTSRTLVLADGKFEGPDMADDKPEILESGSMVAMDEDAHMEKSVYTELLNKLNPWGTISHPVKRLGPGTKQLPKNGPNGVLTQLRVQD